MFQKVCNIEENDFLESAFENHTLLNILLQKVHETAQERTAAEILYLMCFQLRLLFKDLRKILKNIGPVKDTSKTGFVYCKM